MVYAVGFTFSLGHNHTELDQQDDADIKNKRGEKHIDNHSRISAVPVRQ